MSEGITILRANHECESEGLTILGAVDCEGSICKVLVVGATRRKLSVVATNKLLVVGATWPELSVAGTVLVAGTVSPKLLVVEGSACEVLVMVVAGPKLLVVAVRPGLLVRATTTCAALVKVVIMWLLHLLKLKLKFS